MTSITEFLKLYQNYTLKTIDGVQYVVPIVSSSCKHLKYKTYKINNDNIGESKKQSLEEYSCFTKELWSVEKADWCCGNKGYGCSTYLGPSAEPYTPLPTELLNAYITNLYGDSDFVKATDINFLYLDSSGLEILKHLPKINPNVLGYSEDINLIAQRHDNTLPASTLMSKGWAFKNSPKINNAWTPLYYGCNNYVEFVNCNSENTITCAINKYDPSKWNQIYIDNSLAGFRTTEGYLEVQNRGGDLGQASTHWWFYQATGSNIFIKVPKALIASNKIHALFKHYGKPYIYSMFKQKAMTGSLYIGSLEWKKDDNSKTYIDDYLKTLSPTNDITDGWFNLLTDTTLFTSNNPTKSELHDQAILAYSNSGLWSMEGTDEALADLTDPIITSPAYDAVIMISQPNFDGGWCCEIVMKNRPLFYSYKNGKYIPCANLNKTSYDSWPKCMNCDGNKKSDICKNEKTEIKK